MKQHNGAFSTTKGKNKNVTVFRKGAGTRAGEQERKKRPWLAGAICKTCEWLSGMGLLLHTFDSLDSTE
jgi:hypothetical protein